MSLRNRFVIFVFATGQECNKTRRASYVNVNIKRMLKLLLLQIWSCAGTLLIKYTIHNIQYIYNLLYDVYKGRSRELIIIIISEGCSLLALIYSGMVYIFIEPVLSGLFFGYLAMHKLAPNQRRNSWILRIFVHFQLKRMRHVTSGILIRISLLEPC